MESTKLIATVHRLLHDVLSVFAKDKEGEDKQPFEVGVRCKSEDTQSDLYDILSLIFRKHIDVVVKKKFEDLVVAVSRVEKSMIPPAKPFVLSEQTPDTSEPSQMPPS
jgi:hypothetical protein